MSCTLFIYWISLAMLLSTVVLVTDSCSSTFGFGRRTPKTTNLDTATTTIPTSDIPTETLSQTTETIMIISMTEAPEAISTDKPPSEKHQYKHFTLCDNQDSEYCLNGGTCFVHDHNKERKLHCECPWNFKGNQCEIRIFRDCDEDERAYCMNGGACYAHDYHNEGKMLHCVCPSHYTGSRCDEKALEGNYGGGYVLKTKRSIRQLNDTERSASKQTEQKSQKYHRRDRHGHKKRERRVKTTTPADVTSY